VPDNLGMLFRRELVMFGPREVLLTSEEPVVKQFLNGRKEGPIGMSEEKDAAQVAAEMESLKGAPPPHPLAGPKGGAGGEGVPPQIQPSAGLPERKAVGRRQQRVMDMLHTMPEAAQEAIRKVLDQEHQEEEAARAETTSTDGDLPYRDYDDGQDERPTQSLHLGQS
jgi:phospholipid/cholesterol/gamma-HCH transport system ATP-binding protein